MYTEAKVDEELENCCNAVQVLALAVLSEAAPFAYDSPPEKVVVDVQAGTPPKSAKTCPAVPAVVVATADVPFPYTSVPAWMADQPVPPVATFNVPAKVMVPEVVTGPPDVVNPVEPPETLTEVTLPLLAPTQTPLTEKHPPAKSIPRAKVEVAAVPVTFKYVVCIPAPKVDVAVPEIVVVAVVPT